MADGVPLMVPTSEVGLLNPVRCEERGEAMHLCPTIIPHLQRRCSSCD